MFILEMISYLSCIQIVNAVVLREMRLWVRLFRSIDVWFLSLFWEENKKYSLAFDLTLDISINNRIEMFE